MKKQHKTLLLSLLFIIPCTVLGQKTNIRQELSQARSFIKSGKDFDKAERLMTDLLAKDSAARQNDKVLDVWYQAVYKQYEAANERLYLKQKYDTAAFFDLTRRMYVIAEKLDTLDSRPDAKGRVSLSYRKQHAEQLDQLRPNLYYGGTHHVRKADYEVAYDFFHLYIDAVRHPLFSGYDYQTSDNRLPEAAYWATFCGYKMHDAERTLRYSREALGDKQKTQYTLLYTCEAWHWQQNDSGYVATLKDGFKRFPEHTYFFPHLEDYFTQHQQLDSALLYADRALQQNPRGELFLLAKATTLLSMEKYDECIRTGQQLIQVNDSMPEPYLMVATAYLNQALALEKLNGSRESRMNIRRLYMSARPYMENYRRLAPEEKAKWAPSLYRIYFNLNMGPQFEEIDKLMRSM